MNGKVMRMYAVRDEKLAYFEPPIVMENDSVAIRSFGDAVRNADKAKSTLGAHPEDYAVWFIGTYDTESGAIRSPDGGASIVARGSDFVNND